MEVDSIRIYLNFHASLTKDWNNHFWYNIHKNVILQHVASLSKRLDGEIRNGEEKCQILTPNDEQSLFRHIRNKRRCLRGLTRGEVEKLVLNILHVRKKLNRPYGRRLGGIEGGWWRSLMMRLDLLSETKPTRLIIRSCVAYVYTLVA